MRPQLAELEQLPTLQAQRTTLRPLRIEDAGDLYQVYSDPETMRYWSSPPHPDERRTREMIVSAEESFEDRSALQWAIERRSDGRVLGTVTLLPDPRQPRAELGFIIGREHWNRGYAGEAQRRAARFGFEELRLHRLEADTHPDNAASARSLERLGFRREGLLRERWLVGGERSDSVIWGLLASEWNAEDGVP
jgi:RimJ/RimL family protein N-acetyltransferase